MQCDRRGATMAYVQAGLDAHKWHVIAGPRYLPNDGVKGRVQDPILGSVDLRFQDPIMGSMDPTGL